MARDSRGLVPRGTVFGVRRVLAAAVCLIGPSLVAAQTPGNVPPAPTAPAVITRDAEGRATIRAVRTPSPIQIDGRLDEAIYAATPSIDTFYQVDPVPGAPASQKTELWILFDGQNIYATFRCWEEHLDQMVANELRRDNVAIAQNEYVAVSFDSVHDRRTGNFFTVTPIGGRMDGQSSNDRAISNDPNPIWSFKTGRFEGGWVVELAIPFKSIRSQPGRDQVWGLMAMRATRWKNEVAFIVPMPPARGAGGVAMMSRAATLVGLEVPPSGLNLDVKPFATTSLTTDRATGLSNKGNASAGLDVKYALSPSMSTDFTVNTDFAQVEADDAQVNLTRFNLFFPEKREFFLENQGTFSIGGISAGGAGAGGGDAPVLFYSRRIGLAQGRAVPIRGGGRLTGRVGPYTLGFIVIQTADDPQGGATATNFAVARVRRDFLRRSNAGAMVTRRSRGETRPSGSTLYTVDSSLSFFTDFNLYSYWARTDVDGAGASDQSYRTQLDYASDRYGVQAEHLYIGANFVPEVGFVRRPDMRKTYGQFRFSPRPKRATRVRKYFWTSSVNVIESSRGRLETRTADTDFAMDLQTGDRLSASATSNHEFLPRPFRISSQVTLPVAAYDFGFARVAYTFGQQRHVSGSVSLERGSFYSGNRTTLAVSRGRAEISTHLSVEPTASINWVDLREGSFTTAVIGSRVTATVTPLMFTSALIQYNSGTNTVSANVRFRWEYQPGSELFVVYNDQRDTLRPGFPDLQNRAVIVKVNRLFRY